jgi:hypothetical protein
MLIKKKNLNFLNNFSKKPQISKFIKICPMGAKLFHANGWTGRHDEANGHFSQFCD